MAFCAKRETSVKRETRGGEKMGRSPRLAHKAPVMQATVIRLRKPYKAFAGGSFMEKELN